MKLRGTAVIVVGLVLAIMVLGPARPETASPTLQQLATQVDALTARVTTLETTVGALQTTVNTQSSQISSLQTTNSTQSSAISSLQTTVSDLSDKLQYVSVSGTEMYITGANLNIRNGLGATDGGSGVTNGLGNLIVGYNENELHSPRGGSHNIVGAHHGYRSYGGLVAGVENMISGPYASVSGGAFNNAKAVGSSVSGGFNNEAGGDYASVCGGNSNRASGEDSAVSGGISVSQGTQFGWSGGAYSTP
jgi:uncharacterized protein YoxC